MTMHFQEKEEIKNLKKRKLHEYEKLLTEIEPLDNNLVEEEKTEESKDESGKSVSKIITKTKNLNAELFKKIIDAISEV